MARDQRISSPFADAVHGGNYDEVHRDIRKLSKKLPQEGYQRACDEFDADESIRTSRRHKMSHPGIGVQGTHWAEVASTSHLSHGG